MRQRAWVMRRAMRLWAPASLRGWLLLLSVISSGCAAFDSRDTMRTSAATVLGRSGEPGPLAQTPPLRQPSLQAPVEVAPTLRQAKVDADPFRGMTELSA